MSITTKYWLLSVKIHIEEKILLDFILWLTFQPHSVLSQGKFNTSVKYNHQETHHKDYTF